MRTLRLLFAPAAALAALAAPVSAQMLQQTDAPYETKLKCGVFNAFMAGFNGEDTDEGKAAEARAEGWVMLVMADKAEQPQQAATDFEAAANALTREIEGKMEADDTVGVFQVFTSYQELCAPYGG